MRVEIMGSLRFFQIPFDPGPAEGKCLESFDRSKGKTAIDFGVGKISLLKSGLRNPGEFLTKYNF